MAYLSAEPKFLTNSRNFLDLNDNSNIRSSYDLNNNFYNGEKLRDSYEFVTRTTSDIGPMYQQYLKN
jgi:hypothetical protein